MTTTRLIERWLPIAEIGIESVRERILPTAMPAVNYLHVWWARRPLVASRSAVLASILASLEAQGTLIEPDLVEPDTIATIRNRPG